MVAQHERALRILVDNADSLVSVGDRAAHDADVQSLRVVQGRIDPARVTQMKRPLLRVEAALRQSSAALRRLDTTWLVPPASDAVATLTRDVDHARGSAKTAELAVTAAPRLLGAAAPQHYFIAFTTPSEARGGGGLMGNWGVLTVTDGHFELSAFGRTEELNAAGDAATKSISGPSDYLAQYQRFSPAAEWRNVNMSPDFPSVADVIRQLYPQSGGSPIDGVIAIDPEGLAALLKLTGPVVVSGRAQPLTAKNAAKFLLRDQYTEFGTSSRIDFLSDAAHAVTDRLTHSTLPGPKTIGQVLSQAAHGGHLQMHSFDDQGEQSVPATRHGTSARRTPGRLDRSRHSERRRQQDRSFPAPHAPRRVDRRSGDRDDAVDGRGPAPKRRHPATGLPDYVIGNSVGLPAGTNRLALSLYTPLSIRGATLDGASVALDSGVERGLNAYSKFITIPPGATATLRVQLAGAAHLVRTAHGPAYRLDVLHQPMVNADHVEAQVHLASPWSYGSTDGFAVHDATATYAGSLEQAKQLIAPISGARIRAWSADDGVASQAEGTDERRLRATMTSAAPARIATPPAAAIFPLSLLPVNASVGPLDPAAATTVSASVTVLGAPFGSVQERHERVGAEGGAGRNRDAFPRCGRWRPQ